MNLTTTVSQAAPLAGRPKRLVGSWAARGALVMVLFSVLGKTAALGSQIALAWFLLPRELGVAAVAFSIMNVAAICSGANLRHLLVQRHEHFHREAGQVFWLALMINLAGGLMLALAAGRIAVWFQEPCLAPLLWVVALALPILSLTTIYGAALYAGLKFRTVAMIFCAQGILQNGGAVCLAMLGFGALSLVLPLIPAYAVSVVLFRRAAGSVTIGWPDFRTWPAFLKTAIWLMLSSLFIALQNYGANFVVGLLQDARVTGLFFWGFTLSFQVAVLLAGNLQGVLFPALTKLTHDVRRLGDGFDKACQTMMLAVAPVCALQIVLAPTMIGWVFHERWEPAAPVVQWLTLGTLTQPLGVMAASLYLARGQFRRLAALTGGFAAVVVLAAIAGATLGGETSIAAWVGGALGVVNLVAGWMAYRSLERGAGQLARAIAFPFLAGGAVLLIGFAGLRCAGPWGAIPQVFVVTALVLSCYGFLAWKGVNERVRNLLLVLCPRAMDKLGLMTTARDQ